MHFNSHAHVERDVVVQKSIHYLRNFNSHAHVERDCVLFVIISRGYNISTHTLTWSVTVLENVASIDFTFQLTRSRGA